MSKLISIVIPTYKEALNIPQLVNRIHNSLTPEKTLFEIIIVDDNSCDGTEEIIKELKQNHNINLIVRKNQRGLASAVIEGIRNSKGNIIVVMDADLSHPPEKIPELIQQITINNADFVIGSRFVKGGSASHFNYYRRLNAFISKMLAYGLTRVKDPMAGFFAFDRDILTNIGNLNPLGFKIGLELIVKCYPAKIVEIPISFEEREEGESKLNIKEQINYLRHLRRLYKYRYEKISQMIEFGLVGCAGMIVDLSTVHVTYKYLNIPYRISRISGFVFALTLNFILNRRITFPDAVQEKKIIRQYLKFFIVCIFGMAVNWTISVKLFETFSFFRIHYLVSAFCGVVGGFLINFMGSRFYVFRKRS